MPIAIEDTLPNAEHTPLLEIATENSQSCEKVLFGARTSSTTPTDSNIYLQRLTAKLFPGRYEEGNDNGHRSARSLKRRIFLVFHEPQTSMVSLAFFAFLILTIAASNLLMIMQTMSKWQFTPTDCVSCGGTTSYVFEDDDTVILDPSIACVCPPAPLHALNEWTNYLVYFFSIEWVCRVLFYEPVASERSKTAWGFFLQWLSFLTDTTTVLDALAIFPYYLESMTGTNGLVSLRLLRMFRVFSLVRLGKYNKTFITLQRVLTKSLPYFKLLLVVLCFGAAFFGSMVYWLEKGNWKYNEDMERHMFMRPTVDGVSEEPSPFVSIPSAFWWFMVTATTVGYGDTYPTSTGGKFVAILAMLTGVLVIAFPVSVFSDLWSRELKKAGALDDMESLNSDPPREVQIAYTNIPIVDTSQEIKYATERIRSPGGTSKAMSVEELNSISYNFKAIEESQNAIQMHNSAIDDHQRKIRDILKDCGVCAGDSFLHD